MGKTEIPRKQVAAGASRRHGTELEQAILGAAWDVLVDDGYRGFTYEAIAARAGTSRPVLYRRWPQRDDLLLAALAESRRAHPIQVPDTGSLREDAIGLLTNANAARARATVLVSVQLLEFFRETGSSFRELRGALGSGASAFEIFVSRAVDRGELGAVPRSSRMINLPFDLFRYELFTTLRPVPTDVIHEIVDVIWLPLLREAKAGGAKSRRRRAGL